MGTVAASILAADFANLGAQVAAVLSVIAQAVSAAEADLPAWSRVGQEQSQRLDEVAAGAVV